MPRISFLSFVVALSSFAVAGAPYPPTLMGVQNPLLDTALEHTWSGMKARNITAYGDGLVHRPKSESPGDAVSESSSYGMIVALYENDQATFNTVWDAAERSLWNKAGNYYNWRWINGNVPLEGTGIATDADEDICLMLLFADSLVKKGVWTAHTSPNGVDYNGRAKVMLNTLWSQQITGSFNVVPGTKWGGDDFVNPGYLAPANYRIFAKADPGHNWMAVVDQAYKVIQANPGYALGLLPDWMSPNGSFYSGSLGYNPFGQGHDLYKDAIRVFWRLGVDWTWNAEPRAKAFLDKAMKLVNSNPDLANFYQMNGTLVPADSTWKLSGGSGPTRLRQEHSHLTIGMWACAAMASSDPAVPAAWATSLLAHRDSPTADYWGWAVDPTTNDPTRAEDTAHNEMYFDQFLAWFGAAVLAGRFSNIWQDLTVALPVVPPAWTSAPQVSARELDFASIRLTAGAHLSTPAAWRITITHRDSGTTWTATGMSDTLFADWGGLSNKGVPFPQGACDVVFSVQGLPDVSTAVWVAHQKDILTPDKNWLIVDDFSASALSPNLGSWTTFDNSSKGGSARVSNFGPSGSGSDRGLSFNYDLGSNGYQYCGAEWDAGTWAGFSGVQKVSFRAKADHAPLVLDFYLLQSNITDENYFHVFDTLGTSWTTFTHTLSTFTGRQAARSDQPDPSLGTGFRWHIQYDKQPRSAPGTGSLVLDSFHLGGNIAGMYNEPAPFLAMPPEVSVLDGSKWRTTVMATARGLRITVPQASHAVVRDLDGRVLTQADLPPGPSELRVAGTGLAIVQLTAPGWSSTRSAVLSR